MAADLAAHPHGTLHHSACLLVDVLPHHKKGSVSIVCGKGVQDAVGILSRTIVKGQRHHGLVWVDIGAFVNKRSAESRRSRSCGCGRCCYGGSYGCGCRDRSSGIRRGLCGGYCCVVCRRRRRHDRLMGLSGIGCRRIDLGAGAAQNKQGSQHSTFQHTLSLTHFLHLRIGQHCAKSV